VQGDFVLRVKDDEHGFEPGMRVEIFQPADAGGRTLEKAPHGPYRIIDCTQITANGTAWVDVSLRKMRRR